MPNDKIISIRNLNQLLTNPDYKEYYELKQEILKDYPIQKLRTREHHRECMKRIGDLMWDIHGPFQRFIDSQISEIVTIRQEQTASKKKHKNKKDIEEEDYI
jgi:hypothetical protein